MGPIIVEGFDNTGKTTLGINLSKLTGYKYIKSDAPPKSTPYDYVYGLNELILGGNEKIQDRCFISEMVYGKNVRQNIFIDSDAEDLLIEYLIYNNYTIIFCTRSIYNIMKTWADREQMLMTEKQILDCVQFYKVYMAYLIRQGINVIMYNYDEMSFEELVKILVDQEIIPIPNTRSED